MPTLIRAVAIDYDGTLATDGEPASLALDAVAQARARGLRMVLVTGRILSELLAVFPEALERFDSIVAENGAVLVARGRERILAPPVDTALDEALAQRGIAFRRGLVILAVSSGLEDHAVLTAITKCGLDCQLVRNRDELMILPAGTTKATGLVHALAELEISRHNTVAVGDAENDRAMLGACALGVAVGSAVSSLKRHADLVLSEPNGSGVASLLTGPLAEGMPPIRSRRRQVILGCGDDGRWVGVDSSGVDLLIVGGSGSGKSFAAGLVAEQLVRLGYTICIIDPEGDHVGLGSLPRTVALGGRAVPPDPDDVVRVVRQSMSSVVVDLSLVTASTRDAWTRNALALLEDSRAAFGLPHWLLIDEAHAPLGHGVGSKCFRSTHKGHCLVTYRPADLAHLTLSELDCLLLLGSEEVVDDESLGLISQLAGVPVGELREQSVDLAFGQALLVRAGHTPELRRLTLSDRWVRHVRHWHKYAAGSLPRPRRFYFRHPGGHVVGVAGNLVEFQRVLHRCDDLTLERHARARDFSRWLRDVIADEPLASAVEGLEQRIAEAVTTAAVRDARMGMVDAVEQRYEAIC